MIFKSLKRFEKLKIDYSKQYGIGIARRDTIKELRKKGVEKDSIIGRYQTGIWAVGEDRKKAVKEVGKLKKKIHTKNILLLTLASILAGFTYERIH